MSSSRGLPAEAAEQQAAEAGPAPAAAVPAASDATPPDAAAAAAAAEAKPPETSEELAAKETNWVGIVDRIAQHVAGGEERLQAQLAEQAAPGWEPPPYACSVGSQHVPRASAEGAALAWWQHADRCLQVVMARGEDIKLIDEFQSKMRTALARIGGELAATAAAMAGGAQQAAPRGQAPGEAPADGASADGGPAAGAASPAARPAVRRSELAKRQWLMGGLAAAAARTDSLGDRIAAMAAQAQEAHQAALGGEEARGLPARCAAGRGCQAAGAGRVGGPAGAACTRLWLPTGGGRARAPLCSTRQPAGGRWRRAQGCGLAAGWGRPGLWAGAQPTAAGGQASLALSRCSSKWRLRGRWVASVGSWIS